MFLEIKIYVALLIFVNAKTTFADVSNTVFCEILKIKNHIFHTSLFLFNNCHKLRNAEKSPLYFENNFNSKNLFEIL